SHPAAREVAIGRRRDRVEDRGLARFIGMRRIGPSRARGCGTSRAGAGGTASASASANASAASASARARANACGGTLARQWGKAGRWCGARSDADPDVGDRELGVGIEGAE